MLCVDVVIGGDQRADSVELALSKVDPDCEFVAIHDAARPCIDRELVESVFSKVKTTRAVIPAVPVHSTIKRSNDGIQVDETVDRSNLYLAQTPQAYDRELLQSWYANRGEQQPTDESQLAEANGKRVALVAGSPLNIKITTRQDLEFAKACLAVSQTPKFDAPINPLDNLLR